MIAHKIIENISDTARWIAAYRAAESERADALFHDPLAGLLAGDRGRTIAREMPGGMRLAWSVAVRTKIIDDVILRAVSEGSVRDIVNLAAGLDTRPYRLELPRKVRWTEVDLPAIVTYKEQLLQNQEPRCQLTRVKMDLSKSDARRELFARLSRDAGSGRVLVLTEGILMYLPEQAVSDLAHDLSAQPNFTLWVQDYVAGPILRILNLAWGRALNAGHARFEFTGSQIGFFTQRGWQVREYHPAVFDAHRLGRDFRLGWLARAADVIVPGHPAKNSAGILVLER